jgi:2-aminoethylphosphonate transport system permease protein
MTRSWRGPGLGASALALPALGLLASVVYPLALTASTALGGGAPGRVFATSWFQAAALHTATIALAATTGCILLALLLGLVFAFLPFPGAGLVSRAIDTVIALPTFLVALAFTFFYGSAGVVNEALMALLHTDIAPLAFLYTKWGVIMIEITVYTPFVLRPLLAAFAQIDPAQLEMASSLGAGPWRIVRGIILPAALPALLAGGSLCLLLTVNEFGVLFFIGARGVITLPLLIYDKAIQEFDYPAACAVALANVALSLSLFALYRAVLRRLAADADV